MPSEIEAIRRAMAPKVATPVGRPSKGTTPKSFGNKHSAETSAKIGAFAKPEPRKTFERSKPDPQLVLDTSEW